ncbi:ParB/RepB/Spo0J family partition protein [Pajaroellobacter abortibovis]|uniref:Chromosome partitioning protein ParB n=1 Tax=Pajaroellobacter abortibovis TaxID=1882918 RepID=A0A1L6MVT9_9BACT|nr:ParB/RepB/Spo0J family partition protein [Pajaroellobacter abortibovis]APR99642.1 chromosome partitioning protein ParB [Pajaroellobacter abortibovis]
MSSEQNKRRPLGRGLDALFPTASSPSSPYGSKNLFLCPIEKIIPQEGQPRQFFHSSSLQELALSIRTHGMLEPLVVRRSEHVPDQFVLIAGERRWRASQQAGLKEVLVVVKDVSARNAFELALVENVQREDLNPIELAEAIQRLLEEHNYTHEILAKRLGKDRSTLTNSLRLLRLPAAVRTQVISGALSEGHARALLGLSNPEQMARIAEKVIRGRLSVRATEGLIRQVNPSSTKTKQRQKGGSPTKTSAIRHLETQLTHALGTRVTLQDKGNRGEIRIHYTNLDELDQILSKLLSSDGA